MESATSSTRTWPVEAAIAATLPVSAVRAQRQQTPPETLIRNATVLTVTRGTLENTDVLLRNGKIAGVGKNLNAGANARMAEVTARHLVAAEEQGLLGSEYLAAHPPVPAPKIFNSRSSVTAQSIGCSKNC